MTYFQHLRFAVGVGVRLIIHGFFPFLYETHASDAFKEHTNG
jgi:hypothetical protein